MQTLPPPPLRPVGRNGLLPGGKKDFFHPYGLATREEELNDEGLKKKLHTL